MKIPSTTSYDSDKKYGLVIHRKNRAGRALTSITAMESGDRNEIQTEFDRRTEVGTSRNNVMKIEERTTHAEARAQRAGDV